FGISIMFGVQALVNMGVAMAILPTKGLTLPFVSYGGSSLLVNGMAVGILLSISRKPAEAQNLRVDVAGSRAEASAVVATEARFARSPERRRAGKRARGGS